MSEKEIIWDLTELFTNHDDPEISKTINTLLETADEIVNQYNGKVNLPNFTARDLHDLLKKYEEILANIGDLEIFSLTSYYANMNLPNIKTLYNKYMDFQSSMSKKLAFLELDTGKLVIDKPQIMNEEILSNYRKHLEKIRRIFPYKLSETEEKIILEKDQYGVKAWAQLINSWISTRKFKVIVEGKEKIISIGEFFPLAQHPDRETRISIYKSVCGVLGNEEEIYSSALRNICGDWVKTTKLRDYDSPIHQSLIDNDTTQEIIDNLMNTVKNNIHIYQKFLKIKTKLLNLPKLHGVDIFAYLPSKKKYTWDETKQITYQIYNNFEKSFGEIVSDIFDRSHVDASTREGKRAGGWCPPWYNGKTAFIL
ncbi:MAG: M3 family metallopeptidase, partial [Candidatus Thorarchaeota archaeon]